MPLSWTKDRGLASCLIELRKSGSTYGGRLTDSTGSFWEPHNSPDLVNVLNGLVGDLKAYYVQTSVAALKNPDTALDLDLSYSIKSPTPRSEAEMVKGDVVSFRARTKTPGYLYIFNVDTQGVIHPLYPDLRKAPPTKLDSLQTVDIGADGSITVEPPFGRDLVFAFLAKQLPESLNRFWQKDDVGDPSDAKLTEQGDFLDALWRELGSAGTKGGWTSRLWFLRSFESAQQ